VIDSFICRSCGQRHEGLPFAYGSAAPAYWHDDLTGDERSVLEDGICVIHAEHYFVRARLVIPVIDADEDFEWGVWASLSQDNFRRMTEVWTTSGREREPAYFGWLSTELPIYPITTLNLKTYVHTEPIGTRPHIALEPTDHPLADEQRTGITVHRVHEITELLSQPPA
jgi:hypothetical protein